MPSSPLSRLARSLAGGPVDALQSPPGGRKVSPPQDTPKPAQAPPRPPRATAAEFSPVDTLRPHPGSRLLTHAGRTRSIRAWASALGIDRRTLAYRLNHGWSTEEALGFAPRPRDHAAEQARSAATQANTKVLIVEGGRILPRHEAAARLGIKTRSLIHRLRRFRPADGSSTRVPFSLLARR